MKSKRLFATPDQSNVAGDKGPGKKAKQSVQQGRLTDFKFVKKVTQEFGNGIIEANEIKISSWNVNGLNGVVAKGLLQEYMKQHQPDIICFNETKINADKCVTEHFQKHFPPDFTLYFNSCKLHMGYSGTAICTRFKPISVTYDLGIPEHDQEGRVITAEFEKFFLVAVYIPNSGYDLKRLEYRTKRWDPAFMKHLEKLKETKHVIVAGDLNVGHQYIDLHNPEKAKNKFAGFCDAERENFCELLKSGFVDTFRHLYPTMVKYSYWDTKTAARKDNKGWRIDYFLVDTEWLPAVKDSMIMTEVMGSDHCPVELILNPNYEVEKKEKPEEIPSQSEEEKKENEESK